MSDERTVTCGHCGDTFTPEWSEEEAQAEMLAVFGAIPDDEQVVVCEDCYQAMMSWGAESGVDPKKSHSGGPV